MDKKEVVLGSVGILGLISLLISGGLYLTNTSQFNNAFYCTANNQVGLFYGGISSSGLSAYPYAENRTNVSKCEKDGIKGTWIKLSVYAKENNISMENFFFKNDTIINQEDNNLNESNQVNINYNNNSYSCQFSNKFVNQIIVSYSECRRI